MKAGSTRLWTDMWVILLAWRGAKEGMMSDKWSRAGVGKQRKKGKKEKK